MYKQQQKDSKKMNQRTCECNACLVRKCGKVAPERTACSRKVTKDFVGVLLKQVIPWIFVLELTTAFACAY